MAGSMAACGRLKSLGFVGLVLGLGISTRAIAQDLPLSRGTESEREHLERTGLKAGSFLIRPLFAAKTGYSDNVYYTDRAKRDAASFDLRAQVDIDSSFSAHRIDGYAYFDRTVYAKFNGESSTEYGGGLRGRIDFDHDTALTVRGDFDRLAEARNRLNSNRTSDKRATYQLIKGQAGLSRVLANFELAIGIRLADYAYDTVRVGGVPVSQTFRDFRVYEGSADVIYGRRDPTRFLLHAAIERRRYEIGIGDPRYNPATLVDRSANGIRLEFGMQREITNLIQGTIRVGYLRYNYADARIRNFSALSYHGDLVWNVTPLTSITAAMDRRLDETVSPTAAGNLRDEFRFAVEHELRRNFILFADTRFARVRLVGTPFRSREFEVGGGFRYYLRGNVVLGAEVRHSQRASGISTLDFKTNNAGLSIKYLF